MRNPCLSLFIIGLLSACGGEAPSPGTNSLADGDGTRPGGASESTRNANAAVADLLPLTDPQDVEDAQRGFLGTIDGGRITASDGQLVWSFEDYAWQEAAEETPATVNPSLWRQARLNNIHGLFEVQEGIYQVRGFDLANMTVIEGESGWIVIDPLTVEETSRAALALVNDTLGKRPVSAVLFTHSHIDHFGGIRGVLSAEEQEQRDVPVIAPVDFLRESVSENVVAGSVMMRRAVYMYGMNLPRDATGHVDTGLGKQPADGTASITRPTVTIDDNTGELEIDGVAFEFMHTPGAEAPAEFMFYLPQHEALCGAEILSRNFHNLYTLRGAKVRDALKWSGYIDQALVRFGDRAGTIFNSHHWPVFGNPAVDDYLKKQRDIYKYTHDQTMRLASRGLTPNEIADTIALPAALKDNFATRDYYGTLKHNAKAVYQFYFGWYDGNPVNLDPLPPESQSRRYVEAMGGVDAVLDKARTAYREGAFQWSARLAHHVVFSDPGNTQGRIMLARAYDQLGYLAESGPWRDVYLSGAHELRNGITPMSGLVGNGGLISAIPIDLFLTAMATNLNPDEAGDKVITVNLRVPDKDAEFTLLLENAVMNFREGLSDNADVTLNISHAMLLKVLGGGAKVTDLVGNEGVSVEGSRIRLGQFFASFDRVEDPAFPLTTP
ncbi:alkyl/aryl-sulfatase [Chromatocurvus halotolerans]|uniref:Alkyl sulfatase BDS1-like metallo-beta-lactamase superfamily hydrolase n=1 Tax=Chromatocurvus halotolerans TaxID=1132028 RepID=A0A4R2L6C4_9GAMM|nr:alkyl sulfatase dimerization domain-containing protein [Chromatocurvus halotolerans]TCO78198.1 alkyl sulfatase BDS1-like metallo-beta-lactamase superfamily hydrolase [Chromatocurvus halotolerans]